MAELIQHTYSRFFCSSCGKHYDVPVYCGNRFCLHCSTARRARIRRKIIHIVANLPSIPSFKVRFLTLTIPNQVDLAVGARVLISSFRKLRQRQWWFNKVLGGCYVIEVTGRPGLWHVHLHAIIQSRFLPVRELSKQWRKCSPGMIVHIKNVPIRAVVSYVTKYVTKSQLDLCDQTTASTALKSFRMFQPFGSWHSIALTAPKYQYECPNCGNAVLIHSSSIDKLCRAGHPSAIAFYSPRPPP